MEDLIAPILFVLMIGGVSGYFAGLIVRRASRMAVTIAIMSITLIILAYIGTVNINVDSILMSVTDFIGLLAPLGIITLVSSVPFVASFITGLFIGFNRN